MTFFRSISRKILNLRSWILFVQVRYIGHFIIPVFVISVKSKFYSIHFTVTVTRLRNFVHYSGDFVVPRFVLSVIHCTMTETECVWEECGILWTLMKDGVRNSNTLAGSSL